MKNILLIIILFILAFSSCRSFLGFRTKTIKPKSDIKTETFRNNKENKIHLSKFEVTVIDSTLNLFKNNALISIEIEGYFKQDGLGKAPHFNKVLFYENIIEQQLSGIKSNCIIDIDLIPKFSRMKRRKDKTIYIEKEKKAFFKSKLEYRIYTCSFGINKVNFRMNNMSDSIELIQYK